jgi:hypothetical protein
MFNDWISLLVGIDKLGPLAKPLDIDGSMVKTPASSIAS